MIAVGVGGVVYAQGITIACIQGTLVYSSSRVPFQASAGRQGTGAGRAQRDSEQDAQAVTRVLCDCHSRPPGRGDARADLKLSLVDSASLASGSGPCTGKPEQHGRDRGLPPARSPRQPPEFRRLLVPGATGSLTRPGDSWARLVRPMPSESISILLLVERPAVQARRGSVPGSLARPGGPSPTWQAISGLPRPGPWGVAGGTAVTRS